MHRTNVFIVALASVAALIGLWVGMALHPPSSVSSPSPPMLVVGDMREDVALPDLSGQMHRLSAWDGQLLLLNFWATWCAPCREEMPLLEQAQKTYAQQGLQVLGIAIDEQQAVREFLAARAISYPILLNTPGQTQDLSIRYGDDRGVLPYSVLIGRDGRILAQHLGNFSQASLHEWVQKSLK